MPTLVEGNVPTLSRVEGTDASSRFDWNLLRLDPVRALAVFALVYAIFIYFGYGLRAHHGMLVIVWPAAGVLLFALCVTPPRAWLWLLSVQLAIEILNSYAQAVDFKPYWSVVFAAADSVDAMVGATIARRFILAAALPRIRQVIVFFAAAALGAGASGILGAFGAVHELTDVSYLHQWQLWWAGNWLGSLAVAPVALTWAVRWRSPELAVRHVPLTEIFVTGTVLLGMTVWIFSAPPASIATILQLPFVLLALLVVAAFRLPPRWATTFAAGVVMLAAWFASHGLGPFAGDSNPFAGVGSLQLFLAALVVFTFMLATVLLEKQRTVDRLTMSEERYRHFVAHSSEAVWRVELEEPLPLGLAPAEQIAWLQRHARIAECNVSYRHLSEAHGPAAHDVGTWRAEVPWSAIYVEHLETAARQGYTMDGLRFTVDTASGPEVYLAAFNGVVEEGRLVRIWGVARNITALANLNERLQRERERLKAYARQLAGAEERALRATAVNLHDGPEKLLAGMKTTLEAVASQAPAGLRRLLDELRNSLSKAHNHTQQLIADLSPPGLYDLGLGAALQWLSVYMRSRANLQVSLEINVSEGALDLELRILAFQIIRELLQNVAKHAKVDSARVIVSHSGAELLVEVIDSGAGFEWQYDLFLDQSRGFGLFSIADRVRSTRGQFSVDTAPGKGCRVTITFPLTEHVDEVPVGRAVG